MKKKFSFIFMFLIFVNTSFSKCLGSETLTAQYENLQNWVLKENNGPRTIILEDSVLPKATLDTLMSVNGQNAYTLSHEGKIYTPFFDSSISLVTHPGLEKKTIGFLTGNAPKFMYCTVNPEFIKLYDGIKGSIDPRSITIESLTTLPTTEDPTSEVLKLLTLKLSIKDPSLLSGLMGSYTHLKEKEEYLFILFKKSDQV